MGQYFKIVNLTKRQYFSASVFNEGIKRYAIMRGLHAYVLGQLLALGLPEGNSKWEKGNQSGVWRESWAGDRIAIVGDETKGDFLGVEPTNSNFKPLILDDIVKEEFENISGKLICWLIEDEVIQKGILANLVIDERYIADLGYIVYKFHNISQELKIFLETHFSKNWEKLCKKIWEDEKTSYIPPSV
jgi:hypothetical protein